MRIRRPTHLALGIALALVVLVSTTAVARPHVRQWIGFRFRDQIGAPT
ncbi:MAG: hypothetical protein R2770_18795 [Acidimicrobiales bacterium]